MGRQIRSKYYTIAHTYIQQIHYKLPFNKIEPFMCHSLHTMPLANHAMLR